MAHIHQVPPPPPVGDQRPWPLLLDTSSTPLEVTMGVLTRLACPLRSSWTIYSLLLHSDLRPC